jgi:ubiquinone biosynthesis protein Coq4
MAFLTETRLKLKAAKALFTLYRDPERTEAVFDLADSTAHGSALDCSVARVKSDPVGRAMLGERHFIKRIDLDELEKCPGGSLGYVFARHMKNNQLDPEFYKLVDVKDDGSYLKLRMRQTHDIWHVVTGFDTSVSGEIGLQAFGLAQLQHALGAVLVGGALVGAAIREPHKIPLLTEQIQRGLNMGAEAKPFFGVMWEDHWSTSLLDLRRMLNVNPAPPSN